MEFKESDYVFNVVPDWLKNLQDQYLVLGDHLIYSFGERISIFDTEVKVSLDLREAFSFSAYESE